MSKLGPVLLTVMVETQEAKWKHGKLLRVLELELYHFFPLFLRTSHLGKPKAMGRNGTFASNKAACRELKPVIQGTRKTLPLLCPLPSGVFAPLRVLLLIVKKLPHKLQA